MKHDPRELLIVAMPVIIEAVTVTLFIGMIMVWIAVYKTMPM